MAGKFPMGVSRGSKAARGVGARAVSVDGDMGNGGFKGAEDKSKHQNIGKKGGTAPESPYVKSPGNQGKGFEIDGSAKKADILGRDLKHTSGMR